VWCNLKELITTDEGRPPLRRGGAQEAATRAFASEASIKGRDVGADVGLAGGATLAGAQRCAEMKLSLPLERGARGTGAARARTW
jgi:hypothetical protein